MTRVLIGLVMVWITTVTPGLARTPEPQIKTTREDGRATVTLHAGPLVVTQTLTRTAVDLRLVHHGDILQFSGDLDGRVAVARGGKQRAFSLRSAVREDQDVLNAILTGSSALAAFDALLESPWARSSEAATLFKSTREVIRVLQGEPSIAETIAQRPAATASVSSSIVRVRQRLSPSQCWDTYARDVIHFTYELQSCLNSASYQWWNPLATAWCAYEYNLKSSLASIWLLDCYGVPV